MGTSWNIEAIKLYAYQLGKRIARQRLMQNVPVSDYYLFNGEKLPVLPDVDEKKYPLKLIDRFGYNDTLRYYYFAHEYENYYTSKSMGIVRNYYGSENGKPSGVLYVFGDWTDGYHGSWTLLEGQSEWQVRTDKGSSTTLWTNFDLNYSDGTLCCGASEPVPVYE